MLASLMNRVRILCSTYKGKVTVKAVCDIVRVISIVLPEPANGRDLEPDLYPSHLDNPSHQDSS
jgi:hypothetical protein